MIDRADTDNDGLVSEEEFYNIITKKTFAAWYSEKFILNISSSSKRAFQEKIDINVLIFLKFIIYLMKFWLFFKVLIENLQTNP